MAHGESNSHVTDDLKVTWKGQIVTPIRLQTNILKTAGDAIMPSNFATIANY